jgi:type II secretory pathway component PulM
MNTQEDVFGLTEDRLVERLLERLNEGVVPSSAAREREAEERLHEYTELLGLMPFELEPIAPPAGVREKLLRSVRAEGGEPVDSLPVAKIVKVPVSRWVRAALPLAAALAVVLAGVVGWQNFRLTEQTATIDQLSQRLSQANVDSTRLAEYERDLQRMQEQLALVTSQGVEICSLHPMAAAAAETGARGTLFVASDHQHWYLRIDDLEPCPLGNAYQLWFMTADGSAVDGGILEVRHGAELEVTSDTMPAGTVGVNITLEPAGGSEAPSGPSILYGDEVMRVL